MYLLCWHFCSMSGTNRRQPTGASFHGRHEPASRLGDHSDRFSGLHIASLRSNNCRARDKWWKSQQRHHKQPPVLHSWHGNFYGERDDRRSDVDETPGSRSMQTVNPSIWQCHQIDFLMKSFFFHRRQIRSNWLWVSRTAATNPAPLLKSPSPSSFRMRMTIRPLSLR